MFEPVDRADERENARKEGQMTRICYKTCSLAVGYQFVAGFSKSHSYRYNDIEARAICVNDIMRTYEACVEQCAKVCEIVKVHDEYCDKSGSYFIRDSISLNWSSPETNCKGADIKAFQNVCLAKMSHLIRWIRNNFDELIKFRSDMSEGVNAALDLHMHFCALRNDVLNCHQDIPDFKFNCLYNKNNMLNLGEWCKNIAYLIEAEVFHRHFYGQFCP